MFVHDRPGDETDDQGDPSGHEHQIIEETENGNEVRNQIDGTESVGDDKRCKKFGVPGHSRVPARKIQRVRVGLQADRTSLQTLKASRSRCWRLRHDDGLRQGLPEDSSDNLKEIFQFHRLLEASPRQRRSE